MDYPNSDPGSRLYEGKFFDGNEGSGIPPSVDKGAHMNAVYDEMIALIVAGGLTPSEEYLTQVRDSVIALINALAIPIGTPWVWHTAEPPAGWLVRDGGEYVRATYPGLFEATHPTRVGNTTNASAVVTGLSRTDDLHDGMSIEYGAVNTTIASIDSATQITLAAPVSGTGPKTLRIFYYGRPSNSANFYVSDDRGLFERMWDDGAGLDPGRAFFSYQADENKSHTHDYSTYLDQSNTGGGSNGRPDNATTKTTQASGGPEARPKNRAVLPIIRAYIP